MAENTKIQWCSHTFNGWLGCTKVAEGCMHCYAETLMDTRYGRVRWGPSGTRSVTKTWKTPLRWQREAGGEKIRRKVFASSLCDVFEDWQGPITDAKGNVLPGVTMDDLRRDLFALIDRCPNLDWLLLTKRPENIRRMWHGANRENVWLGTSVANQKNLDEYLPRLLSAQGLGRFLFLSMEPQIGLVDAARYLFPKPVVDWIIVGGESKQGHGDPRSFDMAWARLLINQCREADVPCFVKQMGSCVWDNGERVCFKDSHGGDMEEWPEDLRVRQCPENFNPHLLLSGTER